ncbi:MAG: sulfotransferase, partial [Betaproteobacteria bacterium]|nr:sulfotransferase [Betaproteobacteria bacterium]
MQTASLIREGLALQRAGALDEATQIYQQVLDREPEHLDALQLMATVCAQRNELLEVVEWLQRALRVNN